MVFFKVELSRYTGLNIETKRIKANSSVNTFNLISDLIYNEEINSDNVLRLFSQAAESDSIRKQEIRDSLFSLLEPIYGHLRDINIRQLHFHLPNNESFLRFHRPKKNGDNLTNIRYSIKMCNKNRTIYRGFEEGRIFNGFRNVFPVFYHGKHIGSVETSFSFQGIRKELKKHNEAITGFMLRKSVVDQKVFDSESENYCPSLISNEYVHEVKYLHYVNDSALNTKLIDKQLSKKVQKKLQLNEDFATYLTLDNEILLVSFINIKNVENKPAAYFVFYNKDTNIPHFIFLRNSSIVIGFILIPLIIILISNYLKKTEKIRTQNQELELMNITKNKFFSIIAHDLRGPTGAISGLSDIAEEYARDIEHPELRKIIDLIKNASRQSFNLLNNLLEWARMQTNHIEFKPVAIHVDSIIRSVAYLFDTNLKEKGITLNITITPPDLEFTADAHMFETIIRNLISNAIKYTYPEGSINIVAEIESERLQVSVEDTGTGIKKENIPKLFIIEESFSLKGTNKEEGSGLGLTLVVDFVKKHKGEIKVESEEGKGTKFTFTLQKV